ncbi:MAG: signal peptidase I [Defluviitaleaceae bacterium]|nr:signal peptidase I [Defluviitaleaceae bacterium]
MKTINLKLALVVCVVLVVMQTAFVFMPSHLLRLYNMGMRPLIYVVLVMALVVFMGNNARRVGHGDLIKKLTLLFVLMYGFTLLFLAFFVGASHNSMVTSFPVVMRHLWERGFVIFLGDVIRYKLIKSTGTKERRFMLVMVTVVLVYSQLNHIHRITQGHLPVADAFFELIFSPLVIGSVVSYFAIKGSFLLVASVSFTYIMAPYLLPLLPTVSLMAFSLISSGVAFIAAMIYYVSIDSNKLQMMRIQEKRAATYRKKTRINQSLTASVIGLILLFASGLLPIYPVVILTESMTGTFNRGSLVFVERIATDDVFNRIEAGMVIHFISHQNVEYIHRVVELVYDAEGERHYMTQGDAVYLVDPVPVPQSHVRGIAHAFIPYLGYPVVLLNERR